MVREDENDYLFFPPNNHSGVNVWFFLSIKNWIFHKHCAFYKQKATLWISKLVFWIIVLLHYEAQLSFHHFAINYLTKYFYPSLNSSCCYHHFVFQSRNWPHMAHQSIFRKFQPDFFILLADERFTSCFCSSSYQVSLFSHSEQLYFVIITINTCCLPG